MKIQLVFDASDNDKNNVRVNVQRKNVNVFEALGYLEHLVMPQLKKEIDQKGPSTGERPFVEFK